MASPPSYEVVVDDADGSEPTESTDVVPISKELGAPQTPNHLQPSQDLSSAQSFRDSMVLLSSPSSVSTTTTNADKSLHNSSPSKLFSPGTSPLRETTKLEDFDLKEIPVDADDSEATLDLASEEQGCSIEPSGYESDANSTLSESFNDIVFDYEYEGAADNRILKIKPTEAQWTNFPAILAFALKQGAKEDGCFKLLLPRGLQHPLPEKPAQVLNSNAYRVKQLRKNSFWQVSTGQSDGLFDPNDEQSQFDGTADDALNHLKTLFRKNKNRQMRHVRYRPDVPAWSPEHRHEAGVPAQSPIHPLKGDKLNNTKAVVPGIHTPYVYESAAHFGAMFQIHAEDFRLLSLNHLYKGRKIWVVTPCTAFDTVERALGRQGKCSQFMRHRAEFFFPDKLKKLGIEFRIVDQRQNETIVILPDAYHEGFSTGYTLAEAKNYADDKWDIAQYQPCDDACQLVTAIPADFMKFIELGDERIDLCVGFDDRNKRPIGESQPEEVQELLAHEEPPMKRIKLEETVAA